MNAYHTFQILAAAGDKTFVLDVVAVDRHAAEADVLAGFDGVRVVQITQVR